MNGRHATSHRARGRLLGPSARRAPHSVAALRASDGVLLWLRPGPIAATRLISDHGVLVLSNSGRLAALRAADGMLLWQVARGGYSYSGSPLVLAGGILYAVDDADLYAVRFVDGHLLWRVPASAARGVLPTSSLAHAQPVRAGARRGHTLCRLPQWPADGGAGR